MSTVSTIPRVAELQGLYGPLQILEGKVQQVWALNQFQRGDWRTRGGTSLRVRSPGRWNRGAGPDFREAVIELNGEVRVGDVEIHLYREDWWRHGHHLDPAYNSVVLHVVLFSGGMPRTVQTQSGEIPEEWTMGPWMREDLESISGGEPGLFGELAPELKEWMESDAPESIRSRLKAGADRRWEAKEAMARGLIDLAGWEGGLHRMLLYYLGFPFNRRPFFEMAESYPIGAWVEPELLQILRRQWAATVRWGSGRPANRAATRLTQYIQLNRSARDWPAAVQNPPESLRIALAGASVEGLAGTNAVRRMGKFPEWRRWLQKTVLGGLFSKSLSNRIWVDVFLPLLVSAGHLDREPAVTLWYHWQPTTYPDAYGDLLKLANIQVDARFPLCNGWVQGLFWLEDQIRVERIRSSVG